MTREHRVGPQGPSYLAWLGALNNPLGSILAIVTLIGLSIGAIRFIFASPPLAITITQTPLEFPNYIYQKLDRSLTPAPSGLPDSLVRALGDIRSFLRSTRNYTALTFVNTTDQSLQDVDVRLQGVYALDGWGVRGDWVDDTERDRILNAVHYDEANSLATIRDIARLPPHSTTTVYLWGNVGYSRILADSRVIITYSGGAGKVVPERVVTGLDAFIYENSGLVLLVFVFANMFVLDLIRGRKPAKKGADA